MKNWSDREWAWQRIRLVRSAPPGLAGNERSRRRSRTVAAALEQSERLVASAATIGSPVKPILLFYALSQAGRAITAIHLKERWEFTSHGLYWPGVTDRAASILERRVVPDGGANGAFVRVAEATGSQVLRSGVELGAVWSALPELAEPKLPGRKPEWRRALGIHQSSDFRGLPMLSRNVGLLVSGLTDPGSGPEILSELAHYPSARRGVPRILKAEPADIVVTEPLQFGPSGSAGWRQVPKIFWTASDQTISARDQVVNTVAPPYIGSAFRAIIPELPTEDWLSPLMLWWVLLFGLSNLARYEPDEWTRALDVDNSELAVPLEMMMEEALDSVSHLVLEALLGRQIVAHSYV